MNRCQVCDKTDEDDPKAGITIYDNEAMCLDCVQVINQNLEDLSINDPIAIDSAEYFFEDEPLPAEFFEPADDWVETPLPEVSEQ